MPVRFTSLADWGMTDTAGKDAFKDAALTANVKVLIGEYKVPETAKAATIGGAAGWVELFDDTTTAVREDGEFVFTVVNPATGVEIEAMRIHSRAAGASGQQSDPSKWSFYPLGNKWAQGGGLIRWYFVSAATDTLDSTDHTEAGIPITVV